MVSPKNIKLDYLHELLSPPKDIFNTSGEAEFGSETCQNYTSPFVKSPDGLLTTTPLFASQIHHFPDRSPTPRSSPYMSVDAVERSEQSDTSVHFATSLGIKEMQDDDTTDSEADSTLDGTEQEEDPLYTPLHSAAAQGNIEEIERILAENLDFLNAKDANGCSPLHYAVMHNHLAAVTLLVEKGVDINSCDNEDSTPLDYVYQYEALAIESYLVSKCAKGNHLLSAIHIAAAQGDLATIDTILASNPELIELKDVMGQTPIFIAAIHQKLSVVINLFNRGAKINGVDVNQRNIVELAKHDGKHSMTSRFLKEKLGFAKIDRAIFEADFERYLTAQLAKARATHKKLLVLIGEGHGIYKSYQLEKIMLKVVNNLGIKSVYTEDSLDDYENFPKDKYAKQKLGMTLEGVDKHPQRTEMDITVDDRNLYIAQEINRKDKDAIFICGRNHLLGLLCYPQTQIDQDKFHVVAINLSKLEVQSSDTHCFQAEVYFAYDPREVIQIEDCEFPEQYLGGKKKPKLSHSK